jgi:uncharacterized protein
VQQSPTNRLAKEQSPYLLQHARNPVDWYPWGEEAFERARLEDKPVFLSIGYSTCHWCHVMERESFEDVQVAELMNRAFISIKVDREERPDVDSVYMNVCTMLTGSGGWPLTIIMTPERRPFFAATYLPKESRHGRMGMLDLVPAVEDLWKNQRERALESAEQIIGGLHRMIPKGRGDLDESSIRTGVQQLTQSFDSKRGGFGNAPKFPSPQNLLFLLRFSRMSGEREPLGMVARTLEAMRFGGIWDQVGFGFHRYSTDANWLLPHFEKMLYDQAMLAIACLETFQATGNTLFSRTATEIFTYLERDMRSPEGGFFSAEDADSEGVEGKFYVWSMEEFLRALDGEDPELWAKVFGLRKEGNFFEEGTGKKTGENILYPMRSFVEWAAEARISEEELWSRWARARERLQSIRSERVRPGRDDKVLADWNGMVIAALAMGGRILDEPKYLRMAAEAAEFVLSSLRTPEGALLHRYRNGQAGIEGHADDYAFMTWGLLELYRSTFDPGYLEEALGLTRLMIREFWDEEHSGLFLTNGRESLPVRPKEFFDGPYPSANSVTLDNVIWLFRYTGDPWFESLAVDIVSAGATIVSSHPAGYPYFLSATARLRQPHTEVVVVGGEDEETRRLLAVAAEWPETAVLLKTGRHERVLEQLAPFTGPMEMKEDRPTAYLCSGGACRSPVITPEELRRLLEEETVPTV